MESQNQKKVEFESTDIAFHSRDCKPTQSFERAFKKARKNGSEEVRIYGTPQLILDPETNLIYLRLEFSDDITKKIKNDELSINLDKSWIIDKETQKKVKDKEKKRLKNLTRVWKRKRS